MSFFQRVGNAMARFMYGRNGGDRLGLVTIWTAIVIDVVCLFIKGYQVPYLILSTLSTAMVLWALWRMFSRNLAKRRAENAWFMSKVCWPVKNAFGLTRTRMRDREHKYIACPKCRTVCRVDLDDIISTLALEFQNLQSLRLIARCNDTVRNFTLDHLCSGNIADIRQRNKITVRRHTVCASCSRICTSQRRQLARSVFFNVVDMI